MQNQKSRKSVVWVNYTDQLRVQTTLSDEYVYLSLGLIAEVTFSHNRIFSSGVSYIKHGNAENKTVLKDYCVQMFGR